MTVEVVSFGCRLNALESAVMRREAEAAGLAGAVLVNTCAVTEEAVRQARKAVRKARREHPQARIVVTGCAAQIDPAGFAAMPEVDLVLGNAEKLRRASYGGLQSRRPDGPAAVRVEDIAGIRETAGPAIETVDAIEGRARAIVEVQNGCDHACTFCVIPQGRGPSRSVPMGRVVEEIRRLSGRGVPEVVLSGVDMTSYGADLPGRPSLGRLVQTILTLVPDLPRLRLSSIDSAEADPALVEALAGEPRLMPHLHLSLQSGDDMILKRMKRRHSRADAVALCRRLKALRPEIAVGADLIAGFPTETEAMFENTLALLEECDIAYAHVFPFSPRVGTPAARMPQLPRPLVAARAARLRAAAAMRLRSHLDRWVGRRVAVLVERGGRGHLADFSAVAIGFGLPGTLVDATITAHDGRRLIAAPPTTACEDPRHG